MPIAKPEAIKKSFDELLKLQKNNSRKDSISIIEHIGKLAPVTSDIPEIQMGALLCLESDIKDREYGGKDPARWLPLFGSTLYRDLNIQLSKLTHSMTKQEKLICMVKYYEYINLQNLKALGIQKPNELKSGIISALKVILAAQRDCVDRVLTSMPAPKHFVEAFKNIKKEYDDYYKSLRFNLKAYIRDPDRDQMVRFLHALFQRIEAEINERPISRDDPLYLTLYGAALYVLNEIQTTYTYWKSDGSQLATICRNVTRLTHPADLSPNESLACYLSLFQFIDNELRTTPNINKEWEPLINAKDYLSAINLKLFVNMSMLMKCGNTVIKPSNYDYAKNIGSYVLTLAASYAASVTVGTAVTYLAKCSINWAGNFIIGEALGKTVPFSSSILGAASEYATGTFLPTKVSSQIGESVGSAVKNATLTQLTLSVAKAAEDDRNAKYRYPTPKQLSELKDAKWIKSLLKLPDVVLSKQEKEIIAQLFEENEFNYQADMKSDTAANANASANASAANPADTKDIKSVSLSPKNQKPLTAASNMILLKPPGGLELIEKADQMPAEDAKKQALTK